VYWTVENLCGGAGGRYKMTLTKLAKRCNLAVSTTNRAVLSLVCQGVIKYHSGKNQFHASIFEIPVSEGRRPGPPSLKLRRTSGASVHGECAGSNGNGGDGFTEETTGRPKIGIPNSYDSDSDHLKNISIGDNDIGEIVHKQNEDSEDETTERLAYRVADGLGDMENLKLYQSYCRRFSSDIILKAFVRAKEPTPDKIKVSRGALFNFLVQLYAKKRTNNNSGNTAR